MLEVDQFLSVARQAQSAVRPYAALSGGYACYIRGTKRGDLRVV